MEVLSGDLDMYDCRITNCYFENGFLSYSNFWTQRGSHNYSKLTFQNNISKKGTYLHFNDVFANKGLFPTVTTSECYFYNNTALDFGGVFYANARGEQYIDTRIIFKNCEFKDNKARLGKLIFTIFFIVLLFWY